MSLLSPTIDNIRFLSDEEADHNMLQDLQLAAELGKTLLERNKELENTIKSQQNKIEEQAHEIEYMKKQTAALREVNDSRLKIYEQLEVSIQDLERANHLLVVDNANDKKLLKTQSLTIESLELRYEDIQKKYDEIKLNYQALVRQQSTSDDTHAKTLWKKSPSTDCSIKQSATSIATKSTSDDDVYVHELNKTSNNDKEVDNILKQLNEVRNQRAKEQELIVDLQNQLSSLLNENSALEEQLNVWRNKAQDVKNLQDELSTLEEVRQGHLCGRCLRGINMKSHEELTIMDRNGHDIPEDDDISLNGSFVSSINRDLSYLVQDTNSKTNSVDDVVDGYKSFSSRSKGTAQVMCMSLQEELKMSGEFNNFQNLSLELDNQASVKTTNETLHKKCLKAAKKLSGTPTDFSEAETLSSGFSDETSNKATQTEGRPGSLLCSIADGDNCKLSIYDDNSTFESRFNQTPEYRQVFSEIFNVLKRAAEAKKESETLTENDTSEVANNLPNFSLTVDDIGSDATDDTQSVMSSTISSVVSEPVFRVHTPVLDKRERHKQEKEKGTDSVLRPVHYKRQQLDYLSIQTRKKSAKKSPIKKHNVEVPSTPDIIPTTNPKFMQTKSNSCGKRKFRPLTNADLESGIWNGHTTHFYPSKNRGRRLNNSYPRSSMEQQNSNFEFNDYKPSTASQEIAKLKKLDMSYAEVLRMPNKPKGSNTRRS